MWGGKTMKQIRLEGDKLILGKKANLKKLTLLIALAIVCIGLISNNNVNALNLVNNKTCEVYQINEDKTINIGVLGYEDRIILVSEEEAKHCNFNNLDYEQKLKYLKNKFDKNESLNIEEMTFILKSVNKTQGNIEGRYYLPYKATEKFVSVCNKSDIYSPIEEDGIKMISCKNNYTVGFAIVNTNNYTTDLTIKDIPSSELLDIENYVLYHVEKEEITIRLEPYQVVYLKGIYHNLSKYSEIISKFLNNETYTLEENGIYKFNETNKIINDITFYCASNGVKITDLEGNEIPVEQCNYSGKIHWSEAYDYTKQKNDYPKKWYENLLNKWVWSKQ